MKRTLKPTGSKYFSSSAKRVRTASAPAPRRKYAPRGNNMYSAFQKSSGIERKNIDDTTPKWATGVTTWTITCINDVAQGTSAITSIGRKILMKSILLQAVLTNSNGFGRLLIVYDRQTNGAAPAATDVLTSNTMMAAQNLDNRDRFIILADIYPWEQSENIANGNINGSPGGYKRFIKCNLETIYGSNLGTVADIQSGGLFIMTNCNGGTIAGETGLQRVRFVDE